MAYFKILSDDPEDFNSENSEEETFDHNPIDSEGWVEVQTSDEKVISLPIELIFALADVYEHIRDKKKLH